MGWRGGGWGGGGLFLSCAVVKSNISTCLNRVDMVYVIPLFFFKFSLRSGKEGILNFSVILAYCYIQLCNDSLHIGMHLRLIILPYITAR